jgi:hypothetical protein
MKAFNQNHHLAVIHQNDKHKEKEERNPIYVFQAFQETQSWSFGYIHMNLQEG